MRIYLVTSHALSTEDASTLYVEKNRLNNGTHIKKTRFAWGSKYYYTHDQEHITEATYCILYEERDKSFYTLKKLTKVFYIDSCQYRLDQMIEPRPGLMLLRMEDLSPIPDKVLVGSEVTKNVSYEDTFLMEQSSEEIVKKIAGFSLIPPLR